MKKLKRLNARGISHIFIPLLFIVGFGVIGTYLIVSSRAAANPKILAVAQSEVAKHLSYPYVGAGGYAGPTGGGFDCSGFTQFVVYTATGHVIPRNSSDQYNNAKSYGGTIIGSTGHVSTSQLQPGDILFFPGSDGSAAYPGHVGIYAGNNQVYDAYDVGPYVPGAYGSGVKQTPISSESGGLTGAVRVTLGTPPSGGNPAPTGTGTGHFDSISRAPGGVRVSGWAVNNGAAKSSINVDFYAGNGGLSSANAPTRLLANLSRPDVAKVYPAYGAAHGFNSTVHITAAYGKQTVCAYGIISASAHFNLGCMTITTSPNPFGHLDSVTRVNGGVQLAGWAIDPDTDGAINVDSYNGTGAPVSGHGVRTLANVSRPDVNRAYPNYPSAHGFNVFLSASSAVQTFCAYGVNNAYNPSIGATNPSLGCIKK